MECSWGLRRDLLDVRRFIREISHCFQEANRPVDRISNVGVDSGVNLTYGSVSELPRLVRGDITLDRLGLSSFHRHEVR